MITKRIIPCLDVRDGRVVKGVNFEGIQDVSDPVSLAKYYSDEGADELVFYDITASFEGRRLFTDVLKSVAEQIFIPLTVGGGIHSVEDFDRVLKCGADKVSVNSGAIRNPELIPAAAQKYGSQCVVLSADVKRVNSIDTDGVKQGFDLEMLNAVTDIVDVPVIASGGAGSIQDFVTLFQSAPGVDAGLAASIFHFGEVSISALKQTLSDNGINIRRI